MAVVVRSLGVRRGLGVPDLDSKGVETTVAATTSNVRYYRISPLFWRDEKVVPWDNDTRMLALYLLTSPHRNMTGLFVLPKPYIAADLDWTLERLAKPFAKLLEVGFIEYDERVRVLLITNALKYDAPHNPNQVTAALAQLDNMPKTHLLARLLTLAERFAQPLAERLRERLRQSESRIPDPGSGSETRIPEEDPSLTAAPPTMDAPAEAVEKPAPERTRTLKFGAESVEYSLALDLRERILQHLPQARVPPAHPGKMQAWCRQFDLVLRVDKRDAAEVRRVIAWCQSDPFWQSNILSPKKLREKYDTLLVRARDRPGPNGQKLAPNTRRALEVLDEIRREEGARDLDRDS